ncbi:MAG: methyltransferase domain-containing protein [Dehalococcoidia bacterium]|nr:methyltransferase domain-containing protein [Dehalococcoidia bacterium]
MTQPIAQAVQDQFGRQAALYGQSRFHMSGDSLDILVEWGHPSGNHQVLDIATGAGFTAFAFAKHAARVVAYDLTTEMLQQATTIGRQRGLANVRFVRGPAERLPLGDATFDICTCRTAPHHFYDIAAFLREAHRVLKPGGVLLIADTTSPEDPRVDQWENETELLRDPSHVRNYSPSEWLRLIGGSGLTALRTDMALRTELGFDDWVQRSGNPPDVVARLRTRFLTAPASVAQAFRIRPDGADIAFSWPVFTVLALRERT